MRYAVIGAGISGLTIARLLNSGHEVVVYESASKPGGLVKLQYGCGHGAAMDLYQEKLCR